MATILNYLLALLFATAINAATITAERKPDLLQRLANNPDAQQPSETTQLPRQKRWYNTYGLPPLSPIYPSQEPYGFTSSAADQHFYQIHNRLREITNQIKGLPTFPPLFPVIFIPNLINCGCRMDPTTTTTVKPINPQANGTDLDIENRFPEMDDTRQNWGFVINAPNDNTDYSRRPINLEPARPQRPVRLPPPVEHGSSQADVNGQSASAPAPPSAVNSLAPPSVARNQPIPSSSAGAPTKCDGAVITCCHKPSAQVSEECFRDLGCNLSSYANACEPSVILSVVNKIQQFYRGG